MPMKLLIGDFSRMTFLSVKALRYYHDVGLLTPVGIDEQTGYRSYELSQVATAQVIRRFRDLGMPVERIKEILSASDIANRNSLIAAHLMQMESGLERTKGIVASLRALLEGSPVTTAIEHRDVPPLQVAAITGTLEVASVAAWFLASLAVIRRALHRQHIAPAGPPGGLFPTEFFTNEVAAVTLFVPITGAMLPSDEVSIRELPAAELAVAVHRGSLTEADRTFGLLGAHVLEKTIAVPGPIREHYIVTREDTDDESQRITEICWPIFRTAPQ
jgi:DNA-binding transcriptional MerR regulator